MKTNFSQDVLSLGMDSGPDRPAVTDIFGTHSWGELVRRIEEAECFIRLLGLPTRSRLMLIGPDSHWHYVFLLAAANTGMIFLPLNNRYTSAEINHAIELGQPAVAFVSSEFEKLLPADTYRPTQKFGEFLMFTSTQDNIPVLADIEVSREPFLLTFTSGSTTAPKAVLYSSQGELSASRLHASTFRFNTNDVILCAPALSWVFGLTTIGLSSLAAGSHLIISDRFSPTQIARLAEGLHVSVVMGVTTHFRFLLQHFLKSGESPFSGHLRFAVSGGERRDEMTFNRFEEAFGVPVHDLYCSSEGRPGFGYDPVLEPRPITGSCGKLIPGVEAKVDSAPGDDAGILHIRSVGNYMGYFDAKVLVKDEVHPEDWVQMGDRFRISIDGWGYVEGRTDDLIIRGGVNISPAEVESFIMSDSRVQACKVVGIQSETYGQEVAAAVVGDFASTADLTKVFVESSSGKFARSKVPTRWLLLPELPRNANDKIDKQAILRLIDSVSY